MNQNLRTAICAIAFYGAPFLATYGSTYLSDQPLTQPQRLVVATTAGLLPPIVALSAASIADNVLPKAGAD